MIIGLIADVHSNSEALKSALSGLKKNKVKAILHAGDVVGYNPFPNETIALFKQSGIISIKGNHDRALISGDTSSFNPYAAYALDWTRKKISPEEVEYISGLKDIEYLVFDDTRVAMVHGSPRNFDEYIFPDYSNPGLLSMVEGDILVLGHTHVPFITEFDEGIIVNPGSVGQPRDGDPRSCYALLDTETGKVDLCRIEYDIEKVMEDILAEGLPGILAARLMIGR